MRDVRLKSKTLFAKTVSNQARNLNGAPLFGSKIAKESEQK
jgi:hypothetical protein